MAWWVSHILCLLLPSPFLFFSFFLFFLHFWLFYLVLGSYWLLGFFFFFFLFSFLHIYIFFKVFMGSWKLLGRLAGIGMGEVRGAQAKNQGAQAFFMKILYTKKKKFLDPGGARAPFALCLGPSLVLWHIYTMYNVPYHFFSTMTIYICCDANWCQI